MPSLAYFVFVLLLVWIKIKKNIKNAKIKPSFFSGSRVCKKMWVIYKGHYWVEFAFLGNLNLGFNYN